MQMIWMTQMTLIGIITADLDIILCKNGNILIDRQTNQIFCTGNKKKSLKNNSN